MFSTTEKPFLNTVSAEVHFIKVLTADFILTESQKYNFADVLLRFVDEGFNLSAQLLKDGCSWEEQFSVPVSGCSRLDSMCSQCAGKDLKRTEWFGNQSWLLHSGENVIPRKPICAGIAYQRMQGSCTGRYAGSLSPEDSYTCISWEYNTM